MKNLFITGVPLLEAVGLYELEVMEVKDRVGTALLQATVPLQAYACEYECYLELHNSDIETLLKYSSI